ncbi:Do family serine endopeptidase [Cupriavidus malaysiensis]|uniref:Probable periplasmic serine endoprotease DegP-like n=1 Tax=Cupriavidus malaysiensis TaxID=367825 RepID=A0ABN4TRA6_9BURK|nr:Do family serine endopeptidase [Cupriavidus malaysiensis]AOZ09573.1 peptidase [Cupriavidus malaysiensis]
MIRPAFVRYASAAAALSVAVGGVAYLRHEPALPAAASAQSGSPARGPGAPLDFSAIVEQYGPAVVNISVTSQGKADDDDAQDTQDGPASGNSNDPFNQFFRRFGPPQRPPGQDQPSFVQGQGSGFIVSADGLVLTNAHLVANAQDVTVKLIDRREFKAKVVGVDSPSDVAVLRIDATGLPTVKLGDASRVRVGEPVLAIGSPYGFENTVTAGIVSAKSRSLPEENYVPFIQTDAAVNPGSSGGPLFNQYGEVIGINSQIYSETGGYQGLSFAIPIDIATRVENELIAHGSVTRGHIGLAVQEVSQALAQSFGLPRPAGALVNMVDADSPAAKAGVQAGDVIVQLGERTIEHSADLPEQVADIAPGTRTTLKLYRKGKALNLPIEIGKLTEVAAPAMPGSGSSLGITVRPLTPGERRQGGLDSGLVVEQAAGAAAQAGIEAGDVILALNGTPVASGAQLRELAAQAGKRVALLIQRGGTRIFVPLEPD